MQSAHMEDFCFRHDLKPYALHKYCHGCTHSDKPRHRFVVSLSNAFADYSKIHKVQALDVNPEIWFSILADLSGVRESLCLRGPIKIMQSTESLVKCLLAKQHRAHKSNLQRVFLFVLQQSPNSTHSNYIKCKVSCEWFSKPARNPPYPSCQ